MNLPREFLERMERMLGEEYGEFLRTYEEPRKFGLRVNTMKISVEEFVEAAPFHLTKIPWIDNGFYYEREDDPARHPFYHAGLYYLQEPSAMTPANILPVEPGERVLDLCAAPGGKATALGAKLKGRGLLVANDISASRARALLKNLEVFGIKNSFVTNAAPAKLAVQFEEYFDKILVDAPCSGEGMFRKDIANANAWSLKKVEECGKAQREITRQAVKMLRPGGLMLYSTCTFAPEENEGTINWILENFPEMELLEIPWYEGFTHGRPELAGESGRPELTRCARIFPHKMEGEGHFLALLGKKGGETQRAPLDFPVQAEQKNPVASSGEPVEGKRKMKKKELRARERLGIGSGAEQQESGSRRVPQGRQEAGAVEEKALREFFREIAPSYDLAKMEIRKGQAYYIPEPPSVSGGIPFLRNGLYAGEIRNGRFEPSQSLAMALRKEEYGSVLDFDQRDGRVRQYLRGETIDVEDLSPARPNGWQLVCVSGYPLGWGKLVQGTLKNKYHLGWRLTDTR